MKNEIGNRVKELRLIKLGMTQEEFAICLGVDRTYLSRIESGKQNITIETLEQICKALGVSFSEFFEVFKVLD